MFRHLFLIFQISVFYFVSIYGDGQISGTNDKCAEICSKSYAAHTFDKNDAEESCKRGCKIYSVIDLTEKMKRPVQSENQNDNSSALISACERECGTEYSDSIYQNACNDGCSHQSPFTDGRVSITVDSSSPLFPFATKLINDAMGKFDDFKDQMKGQLESFRNWFNSDDLITPTLSKDGDDDAKIASSLQNMGDSLLNLFRGIGGNDQETKPRLLGGPEDVADHLPGHRRNSSDLKGMMELKPAHVDGSEFQGPVLVDNEDDIGEPIIVVKMIPVDEGLDDESGSIIANEPSPPPRGDVIYGDADDGWLACLARRTQNLSMLSRWLLCAALMLSILCMFWLCLALMRSQRQRRRRLYMQYRAGKSDVIYFMPPPVYEKTPSSAAYLPLDKEKKVAPPSPPPSYKLSLDSVKVEKPDEPKEQEA